MTRALLILTLVAAACSSNAFTAGAGQFTAPTGLAATGAGDRDLLFIANTGGDGLRALQLCNGPLLLDGGIDPADTCPANQNGQFVPAPIRVFPAAIQTGQRPLRVAGVRLSDADGGAAGVALVAGADSNLAVVDAKALLDSVAGGDAGTVSHLDMATDGGTLESQTVDVVAANPVNPDLDIEVSADAGVTVTSFVATRSELIVLDVGRNLSGFAQIRGRCSLAPVLPNKLAVVPGDDSQVYVADGAGDGVVSIQTASVAGGACAMDRISAGGRQVRSVALSPRWYDSDANHQPRTRPAGELMMMVVDPLATAQAGQVLDAGGVLFAGTGRGLVLKGVIPIPPFDPTTDVAEPMQPISLPGAGLTREGTFLRAIPPRSQAVAPDVSICTVAPCTPLYVGQPTNVPVQFFGLLAAVSASDGLTYFIDVPNRRFVNQNLYAQPGDVSIVPTIDTTLPIPYSPGNVNPPVLTIDTTKFEPGVTRRRAFEAIWHAPMPGLARRGGTVTHAGTNTLRFTTTPANLDAWRADAAIALSAGDVVRFAALSLGADTSAGCQDVVNSETQTPLRFELTITDVQPDHLDLQTLADTPGTRGFHPDGCTEFRAVAEVRTAGTLPWLVLEAFSVTTLSSVTTARGRVADGGTFVVHQPRFDYPRSTYDRGDPTATPPRLPQAASANDVAFSFQISGPTPTVTPGTESPFFSWSIGSGFLPVAYADFNSPAGFATAVYAYSSPRTPSLVFTAVTGSNEVLQANPLVLASVASGGVVAYR